LKLREEIKAMNFVSTLYFNRTFVIDSETAISSW